MRLFASFKNKFLLNIGNIAMVAFWIGFAHAETAKPATPMDVGLFGNFTIGAGFGVQKATGIGGRVSGVTDGTTNPNSLLSLGGERQTPEGEKFVIHILGECGYSSGRGTKPSHKIKVTSPVTVLFDFSVANKENKKYGENSFSRSGFEIYGKTIRACETFKGKHHNQYRGPGYYTHSGTLKMELLPGEYEVYMTNEYQETYNYNLTLTEQPDATTNRKIIFKPGFERMEAKGIALDASYRKSPVANFHEITVSEPMFIYIQAMPEKNQKYSMNSIVEGKNYRQGIKSTGYYNEAKMTLPLKEGKYRIFIETEDNKKPTPYVLSLYEDTSSKTQHIILDEKFTAEVFGGAWAGDSVKKLKEYVNDEEGVCKNILSDDVLMDLSPPHKIRVTSPKMVAIQSEKLIRSQHTFKPILYRVSPEKKLFCETRDIDNQQGIQLDAFLTPGEYEIYIVGKKNWAPGNYKIVINTQN